MGNALANVGWESCLIDPRRDRALETYARRKTGVRLPTVRYFSSVPWLARAIRPGRQVKDPTAASQAAMSAGMAAMLFAAL